MIVLLRAGVTVQAGSLERARMAAGVPRYATNGLTGLIYLAALPAGVSDAVVGT